MTPIQTICWLAMFYAPLLVIITLLKSFVIFYLRLFYVLKVNNHFICILLKCLTW